MIEISLHPLLNSAEISFLGVEIEILLSADAGPMVDDDDDDDDAVEADFSRITAKKIHKRLSFLPLSLTQRRRAQRK